MSSVYYPNALPLGQNGSLSVFRSVCFQLFFLDFWHTRELTSARMTSQQQRLESPTATLTWNARKYKVHNSTRSTSSVSFVSVFDIFICLPFCLCVILSVFFSFFLFFFQFFLRVVHLLQTAAFLSLCPLQSVAAGRSRLCSLREHLHTLCN